MLAQAKEKGVELVIPTDGMCTEDEAGVEKKSSPVTKVYQQVGWDSMLAQQVLKSSNRNSQMQRQLSWNGPLGVFEIPDFEVGTRVVAEFIGSLTEKGVTTVVGGGDKCCCQPIWT